MSSDKNLPVGTPVISFDDASDYFAQRKVGNCPACGHNRWAIFTSSNKSGGGAAAGFAAVELTDFTSVSGAVPVVMATCKKCAFIRTHSMLAISKWVGDGRPDFVNDE